MKKKLLSFVAILAFINVIVANEIPLDRATAVAQNYASFLNNQPLKRGTSIVNLNYTSSSSTIKRGASVNLFYVFSLTNKKGFIIVSAEDNVTPILGYSTESNFDVNTISPQVKYWLSEYEAQISYVITSKQTSLVAQQEWAKMESGIIANKRGATAVKPLLKTTWDQAKFYNDSCPYDNSASKRTYTGCVATAMAQTMKYWGYPTTGTSSKTYTHNTYGSLKANFGNTTYNWSGMPNSVTSPNMEVARLMFHCGVALSMNYGTSGSSAFNTYDSKYQKYPSTHYALQDYFGYDGTKISSVFKKNFTDQNWVTKMKTEIDQARVIVYEGNDGSSSGHCFVLDGYDANNYFHINWGWSGHYNGYFTFASLIPSGTGSGGGTGNYSSNQGAVIGITPKVSAVPTVDFTVNTTTTTVGDVIVFSDLSSNYPSSWSWTVSPNNATFVNGTANTSKFPEISFTAPGKYTIALTATNSKGSGSTTKTAYIIVNPQLGSQVCDTLTNVEADDTLYYYTTQGGYVSGNNKYGHLGCAEIYTQPSGYTHVSGVLIPFVFATAANNTDVITVNMHSPTNSLPGSILASKTVKLSDIVTDVSKGNATRVQFDNPIAISGTYFISVIYNTIAGDTVVLSTVLDGNATSNTSYVKYSNGNYYPYTSIWSMKQHLDIRPLVSKLPTANFTITSSPTLANTNVDIDASSSLNTYAFSWTINSANITSSQYYKETITYASPNTYNIKLDVTGGCGNTSTLTKQIVVNSACNGAPVTPGSITGNTSFCVNQTNLTYSIANVTGATSYLWTLPNGLTGTSSTNSITVSASSSPISGNIQVQAVNSCGTSQASTLSIASNPILTPTFNQVSPICSGGNLSVLPTTSTNNVTGTWSPVLDNTKTTTYTFTPTQGQCANTTTLSITVNPIVTPSFTSVNPICTGASLATLPTTSTNSITGTWSPALDNTKTTTYTFTPNQGQCANSTTLNITVNPIVTPSFTSVNAICSGATLAALPTTSTNSISGTWSPALDNTKTTTYTFTPNQGQCANSTTLSITVNPIVTPTFSSVNPICSGATLAALPTTSTNSITGNWSPALDNTKTTTYTFTPSQSQCANNTTLTITVNPTVQPDFVAVNPICTGGNLVALPTTSTNSITGTWSPALDNTKTTTYTFTPNQGQCANIATMIIMVNTTPITPSFSSYNSICIGDQINSLPTRSNENVLGSWSPAIDNTKTTTYTFTPNQGQCANTTTLTIIINSKVDPTFNAINPVCEGASISNLPNTSLNSVSGTWSPVLDNTKTTTYTFTPDQNQCSNSTSMTIVVNKIPDAGSILNLTDVCIGKSLNVGTTVAGGVWNSSNNAVATIDQNGVVNAISVGQVSFTYAVTENNCSSTVVKSIQVNNCASISNVSNEYVKIYPNPVVNELTVSQESIVYNYFRILDAIGRVVNEGSISSKESKVNVQKLVPGQYIIRLETAEGEYKHVNFNKN